MDYCIRIKEGKERAFLDIIHALQALGVVERFELATPQEVYELEALHNISVDDFARQYRDLVD
jgi:hypothetical protein